MTRVATNNRSLTIRKKKVAHSDRAGTLRWLAPEQWRLSWRLSSGRYRRERIHAPTAEEAEDLARQMLSEMPIATGDEFPAVTISEAMIRAAEDRDWGKGNRKDYEMFCRYFLTWVDAEGLTYWHQLRLEHVSRYQKTLTDRKLAFDTIRLYMWPIRLTARWVAANWPRHYNNICETLRITNRGHHSAKYDEVAGNPVLTIHEMLALLDCLAHSLKWQHLAPGIALQGLAGLQLQEALRLTWEKVDLKAETLTIDGVVKNRFRTRRIPVSKVVTWVLRRSREWNTAVGPEDPVQPGFAHHKNYSHSVIKAIKHWKPGLAFKPKDLRNTLQTAAIDGNWYGYHVARYVGHSPRDIGERHYYGDQGDRLVQQLKTHVVDRIEAEIAGWEAPDNVLILPGPRLISEAANE